MYFILAIVICVVALCVMGYMWSKELLKGKALKTTVIVLLCVVAVHIIAIPVTMHIDREKLKQEYVYELEEVIKEHKKDNSAVKDIQYTVSTTSDGLYPALDVEINITTSQNLNYYSAWEFTYVLHSYDSLVMGYTIPKIYYNIYVDGDLKETWSDYSSSSSSKSDMCVSCGKNPVSIGSICDECLEKAQDAFFN